MSAITKPNRRRSMSSKGREYEKQSGGVWRTKGGVKKVAPLICVSYMINAKLT